MSLFAIIKSEAVVGLVQMKAADRRYQFFPPVCHVGIDKPGRIVVQQSSAIVHKLLDIRYLPIIQGKQVQGEEGTLWGKFRKLGRLDALSRVAQGVACLLDSLQARFILMIIHLVEFIDLFLSIGCEKIDGLF